jgi:uncharacterized membrane protein YkoI
MKRNILKLFPALAAAGMFVIQASAATNLQVTDLPQAVQNTVNTESKNGPVTQVQQLSHNGRVIYGVTFQGTGGTPKEIYLEQNGTYVTDAGPSTPIESSTANASPASTVGTTQLSVNQLPEAVQRTINTELSNGQVKRVNQMPRGNGTEMYQVVFAKPDGTEKVIYLDPNGTYVTDNNAATQNAATASTAAFSTANLPPRQPLSAASKVTLNNLPEAVQYTLKTVAGSTPIEDIDKSNVNTGGSTVYQAAFKQNGQTVELRVNDNGTIVLDPEDQNILNQVQFTSAQPLQWNDVPQDVKNGITTQLGSQQPESVQKGYLNGTLVYKATVHQNGALRQVILKYNGTPLETAAPAQ